MAKSKAEKKKSAPKKKEEAKVEKTSSSENKGLLTMVHNPFTKETEEMKIFQIGPDTEGRPVAQGFFPLSDGQFSVLLEMKQFPSNPVWTVTGFPLNPIR